GMKTIAYEPWPTVDPKLLEAESVEIPIQFAGKVRTRITVPPDVAGDKAALEKHALADAKVQELIGGKPIKKIIVVPGKVVSLIEPNLFATWFDSRGGRGVLETHLWFAMPSAALLFVMLFTGLRRYRRIHITLGLAFLVLWTGTFVTGVFWLPHQ